MTKKFKKLPKHDFKLDCGDDPEVRQWLHDNGFRWGDNTSLLTSLGLTNLTVEHLFKTVHCVMDNDKFDSIKKPLFNPYKKQLTDEQKLAKAKKLEEKAQALRNDVAKKEVKQVLWVFVKDGSFLNSKWLDETRGIRLGIDVLDIENWHKVPTCTRLVKE